MQEGSAGTIDGARIFAVQGQDVMCLTSRIIQINVSQSFPAPTDPDHFASEFCPAVDHRFDHGVQSGDIAASSEYAYALL
jgi:hypothetical protein